MRRLIVAICSVVLAACGFSATGCAQRSGRSRLSDRAAVVALEQRWLAAEQDSVALDSILAPDFIHALGSGQFINKREHIGFVSAHPASATVLTHFERLDVRVFGDAALATGIVEATQDGTAGVKRTVFTDVFVFRSGRWQAVAAQETPVASRR
jgi:hypothetical protein